MLDEAQLAPARTGKLWGFQHYDVTPDIVTFAKGMSAGLAICGAVTTREIAEQARGKAGLPWAGTYSRRSAAGGGRRQAVGDRAAR